MKVKFTIPSDKMVKVRDDTGTEVDQDVFPDLVTLKHICFGILDAAAGRCIIFNFLCSSRILSSSS